MKTMFVNLAVLAAVVASTSAMALEQPQFVGCRPSVGECLMSCPDGRGFAVVNAQECEMAPMEPVACYCQLGTADVEEPKTTEY